MQNWLDTAESEMNKLDLYVLITYQVEQNYIEEIKEITDISYNQGHLYHNTTAAQVKTAIAEASNKQPTNILILPSI